MSRRPLIVLTNDDGILAPGLAALAKAMARVGRVVVVAPDGERSAISRALSLTRILRAKEIDRDRHAVQGTPADCVNYALFGLRLKPALIVSGINRGPNLGDDIAYSGTVAAAAEAAAFGLRAFALSLALERRGNYALAARWGVTVAKRLLAHRLPPRTYLNVNVPDRTAVRGVKITTVGARRYNNALTRRCDPHGGEYFWLGGGRPLWTPAPGADQDAVA
ncbi:MAG TPA: 5'/3'-nucleotidase SurE, partial [bacterium]|nr:5'/3'-nucleotidase SurE [bacterium]